MEIVPFIIAGGSATDVLSWENNLAITIKITNTLGFPDGAVVKNPPANAGDTGSSQGDPTCRGATGPVHHNY